MHLPTALNAMLDLTSDALALADAAVAEASKSASTPEPRVTLTKVASTSEYTKAAAAIVRCGATSKSTPEITAELRDAGEPGLLSLIEKLAASIVIMPKEDERLLSRSDKKSSGTPKVPVSTRYQAWDSASNELHSAPRA